MFMNRTKRRCLLAAFLVFSPSMARSARPPAPSALSPGDAAMVREAAAYLQGLSSAHAHFVQTDARGAVSHGEFYLQRPGKARFAYSPPSGLIIASNGRVVSVRDTRLNTYQSYPLGMTPLSLFLSREIRLDRGVKVASVTPWAEGFSIVARDGRRQAEGQIALFFKQAPVSLAGWTVTDAQGNSTRVRLTDLAPAGPFEPALFNLKPSKAPAAAQP